MTLKPSLFVVPCLLAASAAHASSLTEAVQVRGDSESGYPFQSLPKSGNHVLAVPNDYSTAVWAGDSQETKLDLQRSLLNADGSISNARARAESTVGFNRIEVTTVAGIPKQFTQASPSPSYMQASANSSWDTSFVITGGTGIGLLSFDEYIHFNYSVGSGAAAQSIVGLTFSAGVYTDIDSVNSLHQFQSRYDRTTLSSGCETIADGNMSDACSGEQLLGSTTHSIRFTYGQPIYVAASLLASAEGTGSINALQTGGIRNLLIPEGASFAYVYGDQDNPLGITVTSAVPEPEAAALMLLGLLAVAGVARRSA